MRDDRARERLRALYPRAWARLRRIPGVSGLGFGVADVSGDGARAGWRVYVDDARARDDIPEAVAGFATTVVDRSGSAPCHGNGREPTLKPGIQIEAYCRGQGTLGCFARLTDGSGKIVILSNGHVLYAGGLKNTGREIGQPGVRCCCCCKCRVVATNRAVSVHPVTVEVTAPAIDRPTQSGNEIDAAIATLNRSRPYTNDSGSGFFGMIRGTPGSGLGVAGGSKVEFVGSVSGHKTGTVLRWGTSAKYVKGGTGPIADVLLPISLKGEEVGSRDPFINQLWVVPDPDPHDPTRPVSFIEEGDSGAAVVNGAREVVGLMTRKVPTAAHLDFFNGFLSQPLPAHAAELGVVCPIGTILQDLRIEIVDAMSGTAPASGEELALSEEDLRREREEATALEETVRDLLTEARARPIGREIMDAVDRHRAEVSTLINHARRVTVAWHRAHGPAWAAHALHSVRDHGHVIPREIQGVTRAHLVTRMVAALRAAGSAALRADLARYEGLALEWAASDDPSVWMIIERLRRAYEPDPARDGGGLGT